MRFPSSAISMALVGFVSESSRRRATWRSSSNAGSCAVRSVLAPVAAGRWGATDTSGVGAGKDSGVALGEGCVGTGKDSGIVARESGGDAEDAEKGGGLGV